MNIYMKQEKQEAHRRFITAIAIYLLLLRRH